MTCDVGLYSEESVIVVEPFIGDEQFADDVFSVVSYSVELVVVEVESTSYHVAQCLSVIITHER